VTAASNGIRAPIAYETEPPMQNPTMATLSCAMPWPSRKSSVACTSIVRPSSDRVGSRAIAAGMSA